jgi:glutamyl-tRNA synthetase
MQYRLSALAEWSAETIHIQIKECSEVSEVGMGKVAQPIRVAITGNTVSPPLDLTLELLGRERTLAAITLAKAWIKDNVKD